MLYGVIGIVLIAVLYFRYEQAKINLYILDKLENDLYVIEVVENKEVERWIKLLVEMKRYKV